MSFPPRPPVHTPRLPPQHSRSPCDFRFPAGGYNPRASPPLSPDRAHGWKPCVYPHNSRRAPCHNKSLHPAPVLRTGGTRTAAAQEIPCHAEPTGGRRSFRFHLCSRPRRSAECAVPCPPQQPCRREFPPTSRSGGRRNHKPSHGHGHNAPASTHFSHTYRCLSGLARYSAPSGRPEMPVPRTQAAKTARCACRRYK